MKGRPAASPSIQSRSLASGWPDRNHAWTVIDAWTFGVNRSLTAAPGSDGTDSRRLPRPEWGWVGSISTVVPVPPTACQPLGGVGPLAPVSWTGGVAGGSKPGLAGAEAPADARFNRANWLDSS